MIPDYYHRFIDWIGDGTGLPDTILHIHAGMIILMLARLITGRSLGSFIPLSFVIVAEFANELLDRLHFGSWRWPDTTSDLINTLLWPTIICIGIRLRPMVSTKRGVDPAPKTPH